MTKTENESKKSLALAVINKQLIQKNAKFRKLKAAEKRVAIAEDALAQIQIKIFTPSCGYMRVHTTSLGDKNLNLGKTEFNVAVAAKEVRCNGCAKGALLLSTVNFIDNCSVYDADTISGADIPEKLKGIFSEKQLHLIETAYEKTVINSIASGYGLCPLEEKAIKFGAQFKTQKKRLIAILDNIIENKGTFKP